MPDKSALIRECARLLKPGGRIVLCDVMLNHKLALPDVIAHRDEFLLLKHVFGRAVMEPLDFYEAECETNGLQIIERRDISRETLPTFDHWAANASANKAQVVEMIGSEAWQQFSDSCDVLRTFWQTNILGYGIIGARKPPS